MNWFTAKKSSKQRNARQPSRLIVSIEPKCVEVVLKHDEPQEVIMRGFFNFDLLVLNLSR